MRENVLNTDSKGISIDFPNGAYYEGTWSVIEKQNHNSQDLFLLQHEQDGKDVPYIIVDQNANVIMEDVKKGFEDFIERKHELTEGLHSWVELQEPIIISDEVTLDHQYVLPYNLEFLDSDGNKIEFYSGMVNGSTGIVMKGSDGQFYHSPEMTKDYSEDKFYLTDEAKIKNYSLVLLVPHREEEKENSEDLPFPEAEDKIGNEEFYKIFYAGEQSVAAEEFQKEKGWNKVYLTAPQQGVTFDSWVVYRNSEDLPLTLQEHVKKIEQNKAAEEKAANMADKPSAKEEIFKQLEDGIKNVLDSERFADWCNKQGRLFFNNYSFRNAILTYLQKPDASYVCGYEAWKKYGRQVVKGAKGIKIMAPGFVSEKGGKGSLFTNIKKNCNAQLKNDPSKEYASYRLGQTEIVFNMSRNHLFDIKIKDKTLASHKTEEETRKYIDQFIIGKIPTGYIPVTVFDVSDTTDKESKLWVNRDSCKKSEMILDKNGNPEVNSRNQVRIWNSDERRSKFNVEMDMRLKENEQDKMQILYECLKNVSSNKNIPVIESSKAEDKELAEGALGYFQHPNAQYEKGHIVLDESLSLTNKVATLFHEMAHSDLHVDLDKLKTEMGIDEKISRQMKETQAEAVAYMSASVFGIETEHKSFEYIANWSDGRDLKALEQSLEVIYKESQELLKQIEKELDTRGLTMALEPKDHQPLSADKISETVKDYKDFVLNEMRTNEDLQKAVLAEYKLIENPDIKNILKEQVAIAKQIGDKLSEINRKTEELEKADTRTEQVKLEYQIRAEKDQVITLQGDFERLSEERIDLVKDLAKQEKSDIKALFLTDPMKAVEMMKEEIPQMKDLSENDLKYLASSEFIKKEFGHYIGVDNKKFVENSLKQLDNLKSVMSKNNTAVEVGLCEQWGEKPIFEKGAVAHPRAANRIITDAEKESRHLKQIAEKQGDYYPYTKCSLTVYSISKENVLKALQTRIDIGDGEQTGLSDHMEKICNQKNSERKELLDQYKASLRERGEAKLLVPNFSEKTDTKTVDEKGTREQNNPGQKDKSGMAEWRGKVSNHPTHSEKSNESQKEQEKN